MLALVMARIYQDYSFDVVEVFGKTAESLLACVEDSDGDNKAIVVYLKLDSSKSWHRFFLQAQIGFWEVWDDTEIQEEFANFEGDGVHIVDYSNLVGGLPCRIIKALAREVGEASLTEIEVEFESGVTMRLVPDSADIDTNFHLVFVAE